MQSRHDGGATPLRSEFENDPDMKELVQEYLSELPARVAAIEDAVKGGEVAQLKRLAHQMRGAAGGYGFSPISTAAGALEDRIRTLSDEPPATLDSLRREVAELLDLCERALL
jgi:HPt (histidine-containing phosphotransfer) domain-containing protein